MAMLNGWLKLVPSSKVLMRWTPEKNSDRAYFSFSKFESRLMLALQIGELNFLTNRKKENIRTLGSTMCFVKVCGGEDDLDHMSQCFGYSTRPPAQGASEGEIANYLVELSKERNRKFKIPLLQVF